jgi:hypothetical protein
MQRDLNQRIEMQVYSIRKALADSQAFDVEVEFKHAFLSELELLHEEGLFKHDMGLNTLSLYYGTNVARIKLFTNRYNHRLEWPIESYTPKEYLFDYIEIFYLHSVRISHQIVDRATGRVIYVKRINNIFERFNLPYRLSDQGRIHELSCIVLDEDILAFEFKTDDSEFSELLLSAVKAFYDPKSNRKMEGLKLVVDAFDRIKCSFHEDKPSSISECKIVLSNSQLLRENIGHVIDIFYSIEQKTNIRHPEQSENGIFEPEMVS